MVPQLGATPERPPRGGHCCAGDVQSRRNCRGPTTDERGERLPDQHTNGKTNGRAPHQGCADERSSGDVVQPEAERRGDLHANVLGKSTVSVALVEELRGAVLAYRFPSEAEEETGEQDSSSMNPLSVPNPKGRGVQQKDLRLTAS